MGGVCAILWFSFSPYKHFFFLYGLTERYIISVSLPRHPPAPIFSPPPPLPPPFPHVLYVASFRLFFCFLDVLLRLCARSLPVYAVGGCYDTPLVLRFSMQGAMRAFCACALRTSCVVGLPFAH